MRVSRDGKAVDMKTRIESRAISEVWTRDSYQTAMIGEEGAVVPMHQGLMLVNLGERGKEGGVKAGVEAYTTTVMMLTIATLKETSTTVIHIGRDQGRGIATDIAGEDRIVAPHRDQDRGLLRISRDGGGALHPTKMLIEIEGGESQRNPISLFSTQIRALYQKEFECTWSFV